MKIAQILLVPLVVLGLMSGDGFAAEESLTITPEGKVGIGTSTPTVALEVNGEIKAKKITLEEPLSKRPRVIHTKDTRTGCPPVAAANKDLYSQNFTLAGTADLVVLVDTITRRAGRSDTSLIVDGVMMTKTLTSTVKASWKPVHLTWGGTLPAGSHTISIRSSTANSLGCGTSYGGITTTIYE